MNINHPKIQTFIEGHFANYDPKIYKLTITEKDDMVVVNYINTKYNFSNVCYIAV
jgi:hypothetical protein